MVGGGEGFPVDESVQPGASFKYQLASLHTLQRGHKCLQTVLGFNDWYAPSVICAQDTLSVF